MDRAVASYHLAVIWNRGPFRNEIPDHVVVHDLKVRHTRFMALPLLMLVWRLRPKLIFTSANRINIGVLALKPFLPYGTKIIVRESNIPSISLTRLPFSRIYFWGYRKLYPLAEKIIAQSEDMKFDLTKKIGVSSKNVLTIQNPLPIKDIITAVERSPSPFSATHNIVTCGKLEVQKGFDILINAFNRILEKCSNIHLTIIGDGPLKSRLMDQIRSLNMADVVKVTGFLRNPYPYFHHADLFVSSSRWEGLPNVILEALACGTPVIATNCPGGTSEIIDEEKNGWLVPTEEIDSLASGICHALNNLGAMPTEAVRSSVTCFDSPNIADLYGKLFKQVIQKTR